MTRSPRRSAGGGGGAPRMTRSPRRSARAASCSLLGGLTLCSARPRPRAIMQGAVAAPLLCHTVHAAHLAPSDDAVPLDLEVVVVVLPGGQELRGRACPAALEGRGEDDGPVLYLDQEPPLRREAAHLVDIHRGPRLDPEPDGSGPARSRPRRGDTDTILTSATRYLYAPSAIPMKRGTGYVSQKELIATHAALGLMDTVAVVAGTSIPVLLSGAAVRRAPHRWDPRPRGRPEAPRRPARRGRRRDGLPPRQHGQRGRALPLANLTLGDQQRHLTLASGEAAGTMDGYGGVLEWDSVCGAILLTDTTALLSESWVFIGWACASCRRAGCGASTRPWSTTATRWCRHPSPGWTSPGTSISRPTRHPQQADPHPPGTPPGSPRAALDRPV
jgi:hypothetical protein